MSNAGQCPQVSGKTSSASGCLTTSDSALVLLSPNALDLARVHALRFPVRLSPADQVMICLLQYFVESLTVVLPYYPTGTMERVVKEGQVWLCWTAHFRARVFEYEALRRNGSTR